LDSTAQLDFNNEIKIAETLDAASIAKLKADDKKGTAKRLKISAAKPADLAPLVAALPNVQEIEFFTCTLGDLAPLAKLENLQALSVYGSTIADFSPLADCAKLREIKFGKTKGADYSTLGKLTQVERFESASGSEMTDISWVASLPNLKWMNLSHEKIADLSPLAKTNIEELWLQNMKNVDMKQIGGAAALKKLRLIALDDTTNFDALASLANLQHLIISGVNKKEGTVDVAFLKNLANLTRLEILGETNAANFDAVAECTKLTHVDLAKAAGITTLAPLKKLPALKYLTVTKGAFPDTELAGFSEKVKINQR